MTLRSDACRVRRIRETALPEECILRKVENRTINNMTEAKQYGDVAAIYDTLMEDVPHPAWLARIEREAIKRGKNLDSASALDIACGTGIVTELLWWRGYRPLYAFDISPAMVAIAETKAFSWGKRDINGEGRPHFSVQDAAELDMNGMTFDLLISLFDSINYILDPARLKQAFHRLYAHTTPGGLLAFDMNSRYALAEGLFTQSNWVGPLWHDWRSSYDAATEICRIEMDFWIDDETTKSTRHFKELHIQRAYDARDILQWLTEAGFVRPAVFGNYGERAPNAKSDRLLFFAEKESLPTPF